MTEAEAIEMVNFYASNALNSFSIWVSITFAFLTVAYLAGGKLSQIQIWIISPLYCLTSGTFGLASVVHVQSFTVLTNTHPDFFPAYLWPLPWSLMTQLVLIGGTLASLYFMWDVRHPKTGRPQ
jgi:hypothetical protein